MKEITPENPHKIDKETFFEKLEEGKIQVISVIEEEREFAFPVHFHFPFSCFDVDDIELPDGEYIILCPYGNASLAAAYMLKRKFTNSSFKSLEGGVWDWEI